MSAWLAMSFLHSRLGVMRSKNSRAWDRAVRGTAVGLSAAAAQRAIGFLGRRQAEALFCGVALNCLSWNKQRGRTSLPSRRRRDKETREELTADLGSEPHTCKRHVPGDLAAGAQLGIHPENLHAHTHGHTHTHMPCTPLSSVHLGIHAREPAHTHVYTYTCTQSLV